jgi:hypothetical protein
MYLMLKVNVSGVISTEDADQSYVPTLVNMDRVFRVTEDTSLRGGSKLVFTNGQTMHCRESLRMIQSLLNSSLEIGYSAPEPLDP